MSNTFKIVREPHTGDFVFDGRLTKATLDSMPKQFELSYLLDQANLPSDVLSSLYLLYRAIEERIDVQIEERSNEQH